MNQIALYVMLGLAAGALSGLIGIGGGVIIVPIMVFVLGFSQHEAQGTTLALLVPPIGILGAWAYYKRGYVHMDLAAYICAGFFVGSFFGAKLGIAMLLVAFKMILAK